MHKEENRRASRGAGSAQAPSPVSGALSQADVRRLLLAQSGFANEKEFDAAMRRYEMYCENLPASAAIPTFMEFLGKPNPASETQKAFAEAHRATVFQDASEVEAAVRKFTEEQSSAALDDFEGLSPEQMHRLLSGNVGDASEMVVLNESLTDGEVLSAPVMATFKWLLECFREAEGEVKLTGTGKFNRKLCRAYIGRFMPRLASDKRVPSESELTVLSLTHYLSHYSGYIAESKTKAWITGKGIEALSAGSFRSAFEEFLVFFLDRHDWQSSLPEGWDSPHFEIVQKSALFCLRLLANHPMGLRREFVDRFTKAFPAFLAPAQGDARSISLLRNIVDTLFFDEFCEPFGLTTIAGPNYEEYRTTELCRRALVWREASRARRSTS